MLYSNEQSFAPTPFLATQSNKVQQEFSEAILDDSAFSAIAIIKGKRKIISTVSCYFSLNRVSQ